MIEIKDLLGRWSGILLTEEAKKGTVLRAISSVLGCDIQSDEVKIQGDTVYLKIKPIYKNEIYIKREEINKKLEEILGKKAPRNLR